MAEFASLSTTGVDAVKKLEADLKSQGCSTVLLAYSEYAKLSPAAIDLITKLELTLKEQGSDIVLIAYNK